MTPSALQSDPGYPRLKAHVIAATGLAYYADKDADLAAKLARRVHARGLRDCAAYLDLLVGEGLPAVELDALIADLTIGETFFFRHREVFDALRSVAVPELIARNRHARRLRVWSAGCSVGAEAYSLAILLKRDFAGELDGWDVEIVGTDINRDFLARARDGRFEDWALRGVPDDLRRACFTRAERTWDIRPEFRAGVSFQYHNLVTHSFPSQLHGLFEFDLILCRNVTIYFSPDIVSRITDNFRECLTDGGWLVVGHAEPNVELFRAFRTVNAPGAVLYQREAEGVKERRGEGESEGITSSATPFAPATVFVTPSPLLPFTPSPPCIPTPQAPPAPPTLPSLKVLADRGAWDEAAERCEELLARDSLNTAAHFWRGLVLEHLGRHADAENSLRRVVYLDRAHVLAHYYLGLFLQRRGQLAPAARAFRNVLQLLDPADPTRTFPDADDITAGELLALTRVHLSTLEAV